MTATTTLLLPGRQDSTQEPVAGEAVLLPLPDALPLAGPDCLESLEAHGDPGRPVGPEPGRQRRLFVPAVRQDMAQAEAAEARPAAPDPEDRRGPVRDLCAHRPLLRPVLPAVLRPAALRQPADPQPHHCLRSGWQFNRVWPFIGSLFGTLSGCYLYF